MTPTPRHSPAPAPSTFSMASVATRPDVGISHGLQTTLHALPRSIRSSHFYLLALILLVVSTLQAIRFPTAAASFSDAKFLTAHVSQDEFASLATPVLDFVDSLSSPAMVTSCGLILVGTLVRGAENVLRTLGSKGRC